MRVSTIRVSRTFPTLVMLSVISLSLTSCVGDPDELEYLDAQQAEARSLELLDEIRAQVPADVVDTDDPLPGPGDVQASPEICEGVEGGNAGTPMYYPGEVSIRLIQDADGSALADNLTDELQTQYNWQARQNMVVTEEDDDAQRELVTDDGFMIAIRAQARTDGHDALNIAVWSPCYSADDGQSTQLDD